MKLDVEVSQGWIRGRERRGVALFAGVPYAAPPVGPLRFEAPAPPPSWDAVRDATRFGPAAPQLPGDGLTNMAPVEWDEDCLTLNVCTPAADDRRRPVLVWIHGGAYRNGTGATPWYDGTRFALEGDIVVVTINYRLGALGFARLDGAPTSGINGTLDQIAALRWVQDNISAFGGDPSQVTIAGESAGAFSVATLLVMPDAQGLFHRAIPQSGAGHHVLPESDAMEAAALLCRHAGVDGIEDLRALPALTILEAQDLAEKEAAQAWRSGQMPFYPSVTPSHLPGHPIDLMRAGAGAGIPVLTGTNTDETTLFGLHSVPDDKLVRVLSHYVDGPAPLIEAVRAERPDATAGEIAVAVSTDYSFRIPAVRMAEAREAAGATTYMYEFDWKSRAFDGALGSCHALEIPFAFGTLDAAGVDVFLGPGDAPTALGDLMHRAWTAFIRHGDPETDGIENWPPYTTGGRPVLRFDEAGAALTFDPWPQSRESWAGIR